ncbi:MAG: exodeoxyribonuclease VII large subunit, partial [Anaerolineae bacterium]
ISSAAAEQSAPDVEELRRLLAGVRYQLAATAESRAAETRAALLDARRRLGRLSPQAQIDSRRQQIDDHVAGMARAARHSLTLRREQLAGAQAQLHTLNPRATLARGYAIVQKNGAPVTGVGQVAAGDDVSVTVTDGTFDATVTAAPSPSTASEAR